MTPIQAECIILKTIYSMIVKTRAEIQYWKSNSYGVNAKLIEMCERELSELYTLEKAITNRELTINDNTTAS